VVKRKGVAAQRWEPPEEVAGAALGRGGWSWLWGGQHHQGEEAAVPCVDWPSPWT